MRMNTIYIDIYIIYIYTRVGQSGAGRTIVNALWKWGLYIYTRVGQSGAGQTIVNALWKWGLPRTCVPVLLMRNHRMFSVR